MLDRNTRLSLALIAALLATIASPAASMEILSQGDIVVSGLGTESGGGQGLVRVDPTTGAQTLVAGGTFADFALADRNTIYAIEGSEIVRVNVASGAKSVLSSGGQIVNPVGIAVDGSGQVQVLNRDSDSVAAIIQVDPGSGSQTVLSAGGLIDQCGTGNCGYFEEYGVDLESDPQGNLIVLDRVPGNFMEDVVDLHSTAEVLRVDVSDGSQSVLYLDYTIPGIYAIWQATGLGVSPNGDIYASAGSVHEPDVAKIDGATGEVSYAGCVCPDPVYDDEGNVIAGGDLARTDMAFGDMGGGWMVGEGIHGVDSGLFRWDFYVLLEDGLAPVSRGIFHEVQVVNSSLVVPEPSTALLLASGLGLLAARRRASQ